MARKTNIVFVGRSGAGKSTVANMLHGGCLNNPFTTGSSVKGVTIKCQRESNSNYDIYDTIGFGEPNEGSVSSANAEKEVTQFIRDISIPFNFVCFVMPKGRLTIEDDQIFGIVRKIFEGDLEQNIVLIVTKVDYEESDQWLRENRYDLENAFGKIPMTTVDFPPVSSNENREKLNIDARAISLMRLKHFFNTYSESFPPREPPIIVISSIIEYFKLFYESFKRGLRLGRHFGPSGFRYIYNQKVVFGKKQTK